MGGQAAVEVVRADAAERWRDLGLGTCLVLWMAYTRFFWPLQSSHLTLPPCPFLLLTGHPCPFCGGTRSFAYTWRGDLARAAALYPLGPLLFAGTLLFLGALALALLSGRTLRIRLCAPLARRLAAAALLPLAVSWVLKLTVLPN